MDNHSNTEKYPNYRLEGLHRFVKTELVPYLNKERGFIKADFEVIGALLFSMYKGEDDKLDKLLKEGSKMIQEAEELLRKLKE